MKSEGKKIMGKGWLLRSDLAMALFFLAFLFFILLFPDLDIKISSIFFDFKKQRFIGDDYLLIRFAYDSVEYLTILLIAFSIVAIFMMIFFKKLVSRKFRIFFLYAVLLVAIGPGLIVNSVFKSHYGRARPNAVVQFYGEKTFSPFYLPSDQCDSNCSFPSGHASAGAAVFVFLLFLSNSFLMKLGGFSYYSLVSFARIAEGGHFFSDVVCSLFFVWLTGRILFYLFKKFSFLQEGVEQV